MLRSYPCGAAVEHPSRVGARHGELPAVGGELEESMDLLCANPSPAHCRYDYSNRATHHDGKCQPASLPSNSPAPVLNCRRRSPISMDRHSSGSRSSTVSVTDTCSEPGRLSSLSVALADEMVPFPAPEPPQQPSPPFVDVGLNSLVAQAEPRSPLFYTSAMAAIKAASSSPSSVASCPMTHQVRQGLCVIFANERIEVGETPSACPGVASTTNKLKQLFLQEFDFSVFVHWNKTGCEMLDLAREARLDLEYKDGLFVFVLGTIDAGWILGGDGIGFPLQDLIQMFGLSSEALPMFFCAHHFPLPAGVDREVITDPPSHRETWGGRDFISLIENQAFMWVQAPASIDEFIRLLKTNSSSKDLALIMNQFAEWTRRSGNVRSLRMKRTFTRLVYLMAPGASRDVCS